MFNINKKFLIIFIFFFLILGFVNISHAATARPCEETEIGCGSGGGGGGPAVVNCVGSWSSCVNNSQTYSITTQASGGGASCPFNNGAIRSCVSPTPTPNSCTSPGPANTNYEWVSTGQNCEKAGSYGTNSCDWSGGTCGAGNVGGTGTFTEMSCSSDDCIYCSSWYLCKYDPPAPTVELKVNNSSSATITKGDSVTLSWSSSNAISCSAQWSSKTTVTNSGENELPSNNPTSYNVQCTGAPGTTPATDSVSVTVNDPVINGACGTANGTNSYTIPTTNLCATGTATAVSGSGPWTWGCNGSNGGTSTTSTACKVEKKQDATCGSSHNANFLSVPTSNLCSIGSASSVSGSGPWNWSCTGVNSGTDASCSAKKTINGTCGTAIANATVKPTTNLCATGTNTTVTGSGPWEWDCNGENAGTNASCEAKKTTGSITVSDCTIVSDGSTCEVKLAWSTTNRVLDADTEVTKPVKVSVASTVSGTNFGNDISHGKTKFFLYHNGLELDSDEAEAKCVVGTTWDGTKCVPNPQVSCTLSATNCNIANGESTCVSKVTWNTANLPTGSTTEITRNNPANTSVSTNTSGTNVNNTVNYGSSTFYCYNSTKTDSLASKEVTASCLSNNWDSVNGKCLPAKVDGACGTADGTSSATAPTTNLCATGTNTTVSGTGPWTWGCNGSNGGTSTTSTACKVTKTTVPVDGGWSAWSPTSCPTACGQPASTQTRTCNNPAPANGGIQCLKTDGTRGLADLNSCPATPACGTLSGTLTGTDCTIPAGASSCTTSLTLNVNNPVLGAQTNVTKPTNVEVISNSIINNTFPKTISNITVSYPSTTFYLNHNSNTLNLDGLKINADCATGAVWDVGKNKCVIPPIIPTATLKANNTLSAITIKSGEPVTLTWTSTNTNSCTASASKGTEFGGSSGLSVVLVNDTGVIVNPKNTTTYTLSCNDGVTNAVPSSVTVTVTTTGGGTGIKKPIFTEE